MDLIKLYGYIDNTGASLGIVANILLMFTIFKVSSGKLQSFSYLILASAVFDLFFCVIEVITQHQLLVRRGIVFFMPHGIETVLGEWSYYVLMVPHIFSCSHTVLILGPQYKYRFDLVTGNNPSLKKLLKYICVSAACALFCGLSSSFAVYQASLRGHDYYLKKMDGPWFNEDAKKFLLYACDVQDIGTYMFYGGAFVFTTICFWVCVYYIWKTWKFMDASSAQMSSKTKEMQRQFTWSLVVQTVNAIIFAIVPVSLICVSVLLKLDAEFVGIGTMVPLSWVSSANAFLTLYIVKAYRRFILFLLPFNIGKSIHPTDATSTRPPSTNVQSLELASGKH